MSRDYSLCSQKVPVWPTWHLQKVPPSPVSQLPCPLQGRPLGVVIVLATEEAELEVEVVAVDAGAVAAAVAKVTFAKQPSVSGRGDMIRLIIAGLHMEK